MLGIFTCELIYILNLETYPDLYTLLLEHRRPSDYLWDSLCAMIRHRVFWPREIWVDIGQVPSSLCMIRSGSALGYGIINGERKLQRIWKEGDLILMAESGLAFRKAVIQVIFPVDAEVLELSYIDLGDLREDYPEMHRYIDGFVADELQERNHHIQWMKDRTGEERIQDFQRWYPSLYHTLSDADVASYLGISRRWYNLKK